MVLRYSGREKGGKVVFGGGGEGVDIGEIFIGNCYVC